MKCIELQCRLESLPTGTPVGQLSPEWVQHNLRHETYRLMSSPEFNKQTLWGFISEQQNIEIQFSFFPPQVNPLPKQINKGSKILCFLQKALMPVPPIETFY